MPGDNGDALLLGRQQSQRQPICWWYFNTMEILDEEYGHVVGQKMPNMFGCMTPAETSGMVRGRLAPQLYRRARRRHSLDELAQKRATRKEGRLLVRLHLHLPFSVPHSLVSSFAYPYVGFRIAR